MKKLTIYSDGTHSVGDGGITISAPNTTVTEVYDLSELTDKELKEIEIGNLHAATSRANKVDTEK